MGAFFIGIQALCCAAASTGAAPATPVILDTDIGSDIDDTWALAMLLSTPQLDVKLITTSLRDTPTKTRLVAKILERLARTDIPIGTGIKTGDGGINQLAWLGDYSLEHYPGRVIEDGVQAIIDTINASKEPITLLVIGPQTNIKEALRRDPEIAKKARVVAMAGSVHIGYDGKPERSPEWNIACDIEAARAVLAAPWEITWAPLDTCGTLRLSGEHYLAVRDSKAPAARVVIENYDQWRHRKQYPADASSVLFDTLAVYLAYDSVCCAMETVRLSIDDKGNTVPDSKGNPVRCALQWKDREAFEHVLIQTLTQGKEAPAANAGAEE